MNIFVEARAVQSRTTYCSDATFVGTDSVKTLIAWSGCRMSISQKRSLYRFFQHASEPSVEISRCTFVAKIVGNESEPECENYSSEYRIWILVILLEVIRIWGYSRSSQVVVEFSSVRDDVSFAFLWMLGGKADGDKPWYPYWKFSFQKWRFESCSQNIVNLSDGCTPVRECELVVEVELVKLVQSETIVEEILKPEDLSTRAISSESDTSCLGAYIYIMFCVLVLSKSQSTWELEWIIWFDCIRILWNFA